jgi:hypothetical protein
VDEAKAVYPFMAIGANIAMVASGCYIRLVNHTLSTTVAGAPHDVKVPGFCCCCCCCCCCALCACMVELAPAWYGSSDGVSC